MEFLTGIMGCPQWKTKDGHEMQFGGKKKNTYVNLVFRRFLVKKIDYNELLEGFFYNSVEKLHKKMVLTELNL